MATKYTEMDVNVWPVGDRRVGRCPERGASTRRAERPRSRLRSSVPRRAKRFTHIFDAQSAGTVYIY